MRAGEATARARKMSPAYDADGGRRPRRLRQCTSGAPTASHFRRLRVHFGNHDRDRALRHVAAGDVGAQGVGGDGDAGGRAHAPPSPAPGAPWDTPAGVAPFFMGGGARWVPRMWAARGIPWPEPKPRRPP